MKRPVVILVMLAAIPAFGQAARFSYEVYTINSSYPLPGGLYPVLSYPGATIAVCNAPATGFTVLNSTTNTISNGCTNYATTYTNAAESGTCSSPTQLTRTSSTTCVGTADAEGGWGVWMGAGTYQFTVTTVQGSYGPYDFSVGGGGGGVTSLNSLTGALSITGDSTITVTPSGSSIALHATGSAGSGTLNFIPLWTPNGTTLGNSHLDDGVTTANTITSSETVQSIVSGQDANAFFGINNGTSTFHVEAANFLCPNITTSTVSGCVIGLGNAYTGANAERLSIEYRDGGSVAADRGALSMSTTGTDNQEALMWDWAGNVYLPQLVSAASLATDSTGKIIAGSISSGITQLTGDGTAGPGSGSQPFTLATVNASPGSCGDSTHVCQITTNGKGLTTSQTAVAITGGGSGFPITVGNTSIAASSTTTTINDLTLTNSPSINNVIYLSCSTELGAQINSAVTALGAAGGIIVFPNCNIATWTTPVTVSQANISFLGYGQRATKIACTLASAGTCLVIHEAVDWATTSLSVGSEISGFTMFNGGSTVAETLISGEGLNGFTIHDVAFNGKGTSGNDGLTTCFEFHNTTTDATFTEGNTTYNFELGQQCYVPVLMTQDSGDANQSFGYNNFNFHMAANAVYGIQFNGTGYLYNGSLTVFANMVGTGGGVLQFNNAFSTTRSGTGPNPGEHFYITAECDTCSGSSVVDMNGTGDVQADGWINNGAYNGVPLANLCTGSCTWPNFVINNAEGMTGSVSGFNTYLAADKNEATGTNIGITPRDFLCPAMTGGSSCEVAVGIDGANNNNQAVLGFHYVSTGSTSNYGYLGLLGTAVFQFTQSAITVPAATMSLGGSGFNPGGNMLALTGNWSFGTDFAVSNTSSGGHAFAFDATGSGSGLVGAFAVTDTTESTWPLATYCSSASACQVFTLSGSSYSFSATASGGMANANQNAGISSPGSGLLSADTTTKGNTDALFESGGFASKGTKFTTSGCSISSTTGGATAGIFTLGANSCTAVITMNGATGMTAPNGWTCQAHDRTAPTVLIGGESSSTTTTASITIPSGAGSTDVISFSCVGY